MKGSTPVRNLALTAAALLSSPFSSRARRALSLAAVAMRAPAADLLPRLSWEAFLPDDDLALGRIAEREGNTALTEIAALCLTIRRYGCKSVLEIGTFDGRTTYNLATHVGPGGRVVTVNLPPDQLPVQYIHEGGRIVSGARFHGTPVADRIRELFRDTSEMESADFGATFDLIYNDGDIRAEGILRDCRLIHGALKRTGRGIIFWRNADYLSGQLALSTFCREKKWSLPYRLQGTRLAVMFFHNAHPVDVRSF